MESIQRHSKQHTYIYFKTSLGVQGLITPLLLDIHLGGEDFNHKVAEYFAAEAVAQGIHTYYQ